MINNLINRDDAIDALRRTTAHTSSLSSWANEMYERLADIPADYSAGQTVKVEDTAACYYDEIVHHYLCGMCGVCGKTVYDHAGYCAECGAKLDWSKNDDQQVLLWRKS